MFSRRQTMFLIRSDSIAIINSKNDPRNSRWK